MKPALENLLIELKKPENEEKVRKMIEIAQFKNKEALFHVLTDGKGPKLSVIDLFDSKKETKEGINPNTGLPGIKTSITTIATEESKSQKYGLNGKTAIALTQTNYTKGTTEVFIDDAVARSISLAKDQNGNLNPEIKKIFEAIILHEIGHVGDQKDKKDNNGNGAGREVGESIEKLFFNEVIKPAMILHDYQNETTSETKKDEDKKK